MDNSTTGPVCVIVGAGEGLGRALAARFAAEGCEMVLISRSMNGSAMAANAAKQANGNVRVCQLVADASDVSSIESAMNTVRSELGEIGILIYNARTGFRSCEPLEMTAGDLHATFAVEVVGAFNAAKAVLPSMRTRGQGTVLFSSATAAFRGSASYPLYAIGKFGLRALSQSLAKAYGSDGVHVAHVRLDCDLDVPAMKELYGEAYDTASLADPDAVAETYWWVHAQPKGAWSNEVEVRPGDEPWTY